MAWILTVAIIRPSDGKVVKVNADEVIFYTNQGWERADDVGKTSGGEPRVKQATGEQTTGEPKVEVKPKPANDDSMNDIII